MRQSNLFLEIGMPTMMPRPRPEPPSERELTLYEMLDDPIVVRVMRRDGVARSDVTRLFAARQRGRALTEAPASRRACRRSTKRSN